MARSYIPSPSTPIWSDDTIIFLKMKTVYHVARTSSAGIISTGFSPAYICSAIPLLAYDSGVGESRDLQLTLQPSSDGSSMLIIAKHRDGSIWANTEIAYRLIHFDDYLG